MPVGDLDMKRLAHPIGTHGVFHRDAETGSSFQLEFDPTNLAPEDTEAANEALRRALEQMESDSGN